ncbi:MAG TPA: hypothetical protein VM822_02405, partial [Pseudolabrys sp.]|nr:hypothetical protein [Pseudolabrys sp.]
MRRREFINLIGSTAVWPLTARTANNAAEKRVSQQLIPWPARETWQWSSENRTNVDTKDSGVWLLEITNYLCSRRREVHY